MSDNDEDTFDCVKKGNYIVIKGTNVVVDPVKPRILGIVIEQQGRWVLVVPDTPTAEMRSAASEYYFRLPDEESDSESDSGSHSTTNSFDIQKILNDLNAAQEEISAIQSRLSDLEEIKVRLQRVQDILEKSLT
uniref:Uncharacterized protein n=1 Tax=viral metagenome TaxID=1070528 RepID=A0A6C0KVW8_9ZZZZ